MHTKKGLTWELIRLFFPISLIALSSVLFLLFEKLLLAKLSPILMEAAVTASYPCQIFQGASIALAMMAQVCVGRWHGSKELKQIGPGIWQFIWFSCLSMVISVPLSMIYGNFYFRGTDIEAIVWPYYSFLVWINFLYPLATSLTCFYLGLGHTKLILWSTISSQVLRLMLTYVLIFGWEGWMPAWGILGGAMSTLISQGVFCLLLLFVFLNPKNADIYGSRTWRFQPKLFYESVYPGVYRAICRLLTFACWASITHLMTVKGGQYLLILSLGGTLFMFLPFVADAVYQSQTTIVSHILGSKDYHLLDNAFRSGLLLVVIITALFSIPFIFFPFKTFNVLFPQVVLAGASIYNMFIGVWLCFGFFTFVFVPISYIMAFKDTKFTFFMGLFNWINGYLFMYVAIEKMQISADLFWIVLSLMHASTALIYYWRMRWLQSRLVFQKEGVIELH